MKQSKEKGFAANNSASAERRRAIKEQAAKQTEMQTGPTAPSQQEAPQEQASDIPESLQGLAIAKVENDEALTKVSEAGQLASGQMGGAIGSRNVAAFTEQMLTTEAAGFTQLAENLLPARTEALHRRIEDFMKKPSVSSGEQSQNTATEQLLKGW